MAVEELARAARLVSRCPRFRGGVVKQGSHEWPAAGIVLIVEALARGNNPALAMLVFDKGRAVVEGFAAF